ncbi:carboxypeptidase-like regulatory domain-containing protein [Sphingobacterium sp. E70]|uniref:carboxypeptidase regulatory-like domain-containing protein n=1 Tax=Sphingobacterium sp. E70 TaxID=2853439 RepID=UPI00211CBCE7|nr:carboxypeptidase regulatory-like domain-containing protein [Sphingobacterium sp. E70]ULT26654.1 carboxypeptidase-like regulatory domain-containing protein [Sphingobacterium sp. E70]
MSGWNDQWYCQECCRTAFSWGQYYIEKCGSNFSTSSSSASDGSFRFAEVPNAKGYELTFSYVGYQTYVEKDVQVSVSGATTLSIILEDQVNQLEDVVVIGYGKQKKVI